MTDYFELTVTNDQTAKSNDDKDTMISEIEENGKWPLFYIFWRQEKYFWLKKTKGKVLKLRKLWEQKRIIRHLKHNF